MKKMLYLLPMLLLATGVFAQQQKINGVVTSRQNKTPIPGVTVQAGSRNTMTNGEGKFSIMAAQGEELLFTYIGMKPLRVKIDAQTNNLSVEMEDNVTDLNQIVVTGYQTQRKADLTGAVAVVNMKDVKDIPTGNVISGLQSRVPGMNITTDGTPGGTKTGVLIRGKTTINDASPLYVIDGVMTRENISSILSSNDVESIQVLKDAASASIYGAQAANGVIIITTKRAKTGILKVDLDVSTTLQTFTSGVKLLNAQQWGDVYWQAYKNNYGTHPNSAVYGNGESAELQEYYFNNGTTKIKTGNTDWLKEIFNSAVMQNYNLTLSKGAENGATSLSINYLNQDGLTRNTNFERFNSRLASEYRYLNNRLRIGGNAIINRWTEVLSPGGIEEQAIAQHPAIPLYDESGNYAGGYVDILGDKSNMIRLTDNEKNNRRTRWRVFGNGYVEIEPVKNLVIKSNLGINYYNEFNSVFVPSWTEASRSVNTNELTVSNSYKYDWVWSNTATYNLTAKKNNVSFLLGTEAKKNYAEYLEGYGTGLAIENKDYRYLDAATSGLTVSNYASTYAMVSYFGKINYSYDGKYLASGTLRRDASSRFGPNNNAAVFPAVSAGWRLKKEPFLENVNWIGDLKLRGSWGINGNDMIDNEATYTKYLVSLGSASYNLNGDGSTLSAGAYKTLSANRNLKWEQTQQTNIGIDASFLNDRLGVSLDGFVKNTKDMLIRRDYIAVIGEGGYYYYNGISMKNKGIEAAVSWRDQQSDFHYEIAFNFSYYRNEISNLPEDIYYTYGGGDGVDQSIVGQPYGSWMGYKTDGLFRTQEQVDKYNAQYNVQIGSPGIGRIRYKDLNSDGIINTADRTWLGSDNPKFTGGLNLSGFYKAFDLTLFFNGMVRKAWNNSKYYTDLFQGWAGNHSVRLLDALNASKAFETTGYYSGNIPALTTTDNNNETRSSDFYVEDGSFIKLKTVTLGYTLPKGVLSRLNMNHARVYLQSQNLFTITKYTGADPEGVGYPYPLPRTYTLGLSVGF